MSIINSFFRYLFYTTPTGSNVPDSPACYKHGIPSGLGEGFKTGRSFLNIFR